MFSASFYNVIHILGILMVFLALGAMILQSGVSAAGENPWKKRLAMTHGIGLLLILVAGFGMVAKLQYSLLSGWVIVKFLIWLILGGLPVLIARKQEMGGTFWLLALLLGTLAGYMAIVKPF